MSDTDKLEKLCSCCEGIPALQVRGDGRMVNHGSVGAIRSGKEQNCPFCMVLYQSLKLYEVIDESEFGDSLIELLVSSQCRMSAFLRHPEIPRFNRQASFSLKFVDAHDLTFPLISKDIASAKEKLSKCIKSHQCGPQESVQLPTRLLDVSGPDESIIRLFVPEGRVIGKYAALSYCWGGAISSQTTSTNVTERSSGFLVDSLPLTIQDAILFTRGLGLKYLWVDSFCIIQGADDVARHDWDIESTKMETVYSNALFTIVAASAKSSNQGLFSRRNTGLSIFCDDDYTNRAGVWKIFQFAKACVSGSKAGNFTALILPHEEFKDDPINSRAWTLQEWILSPRLLICSWSRILFQCTPLRGHTARKDIYTYRLPAQIRRADWRLLVENFCTRTMTNAQDKLPAISGLARAYQARLAEPVRYCAGLWESHLPEGLLWVRDTMFFKSYYVHPNNSIPESYRAPSWSWAATDGVVDFMFVSDNLTSKLLVEILKINVELVNNNDSFGRLKSSELIIRGPLKQASSIKFPDPSSTPRRPNLYGIWDETSNEARLGAFWLDDQSEDAVHRVQQLSSIFCLLFTKPPHYCGLVLVPVEGKTGTYSRIGAFYCERAQWFDNAAIQSLTII